MSWDSSSSSLVAANPDPASKILGPKYGSGADLMTIYEQNKAASNSSEVRLAFARYLGADSSLAGRCQEEDVFFKLVLVLNSIDVKLLRSSMEHLSKVG